MRDHSLVSVIRSKSYVVLAAAVFFATIVLPGKADAAGADVVSVHAEKLMPRVFRFDVTVLHQGESPEHYVDWWEILDEQGETIDVRKLAHPHVNEQPFTRSLSHVTIPVGTRTVTVRAHDTVHGYEGRALILPLDIESRYDPVE